MTTLSPPPYREKDLTSQPWQKWFASVHAAIVPPGGAISVLWSAINKSNANLTDIPIRNHADLQNLNTDLYTHLSADSATQLTSGGDTSLHYHSADRVLDSVNPLPGTFQSATITVDDKGRVTSASSNSKGVFFAFAAAHG